MPSKDAPKKDGKAGSKEKEKEKKPTRQQLTEQVATMQKLARAQETARSLRASAAKVANPTERERMLQEAYAREKEAHGDSAAARRMQSGAWQGLIGGSAIGGGTGMGVGVVVGTLVGGLVSIPTTGIGALVGLGVGAVRGPWIKFGGGKEGRDWVEAKPEEVVDAMEMEQKAGGRVEEVKDEVEATPAPAAAVTPTPKKKPRKLEVRSQRPGDGMKRTPSQAAPGNDEAGQEGNGLQEVQVSSVNNIPVLPRDRARKPKKLQVRSQPKAGDGNDSGYGEEV